MLSAILVINAIFLAISGLSFILFNKTSFDPETDIVTGKFALFFAVVFFLLSRIC